MVKRSGPRLGQLVWPGGPAQAQPGPQFPGTAVQQPATAVTLRILSTKRHPVEGATVRVYAVPVHGSPYEVASGETGPEGIYIFSSAGIPTEEAYRYDLQASKSGHTVSTTTAIPGKASKKSLILCVAEEDPLICEVAQKQEFYRGALAEQQAAWGATDFSGRQAHAALRNLPVQDARLEPYFNRISWGVSDLGIPPQDWPEISTYYQQTQRVLDRVPWPVFTGAAEKIGEYFRSCAEARIPVAVGHDGIPLVIRDFRLYSPTWSDFFPKSDAEIRRAFALAWASNMSSISDCVNHRVRKKAREAERTMKMMSLAGVAVVPILAGPFGLGPPGLAAVFVGQVVQHVRLRTGDDFSENLSQSLPKLSEDLLQPGLTEAGASVIIVSALLVHYIDSSDLSPKAKAAAKVAIPKIADKVVQEKLTADVTIPDYILAQQAISAILVTLVSSAIRAEGMKDAKEVGRMVLGYRTQAEAAMIPFQVWLYRTLLVGDIIEEAAKDAGVEFDAERDLYGVAEEEAAKAGVEIPAEAKTPESADGASPVASSAGEGIVTIGAGALILGLLGTATLGG